MQASVSAGVRVSGMCYPTGSLIPRPQDRCLRGKDGVSCRFQQRGAGGDRGDRCAPPRPQTVRPDPKSSREVESAGFPTSQTREIRESRKRFPFINPKPCEWKGRGGRDRACPVLCVLVAWCVLRPLPSHPAGHDPGAPAEDRVGLHPDAWLLWCGRAHLSPLAGTSPRPETASLGRAVGCWCFGSRRPCPGHDHEGFKAVCGVSPERAREQLASPDTGSYAFILFYFRIWTLYMNVIQQHPCRRAPGSSVCILMYIPRVTTCMSPPRTQTSRNQA